MTTDECIALSDDELVDAAYPVVDELAESADEAAARGLRRRQAARLLRDTLSG